MAGCFSLHSTNMLLKPSLKGEPRFIRSIHTIIEATRSGLLQHTIIGQAGSSGSFWFLTGFQATKLQLLKKGLIMDGDQGGRLARLILTGVDRGPPDGF